MRSRRVGVGLVVVLAAATVLAACGRRGALEPPPQAGAPTAAEVATSPDPLVSVPAPGAGAAPRAPEPAVPDRPFLLDVLL